MSMYAINEQAIDHPGASASRPYLRLVTPPAQSPGRASRAVYRRRRLVVVVLMAVALLLAAKALEGGALVGGAPAGPEASGDRRLTPEAMSGAYAPRTYVVKQGDTLWSIARHLQPGGDVRPVVDRLAARHRGAPLRVGERIALP